MVYITLVYHSECRLVPSDTMTCMASSESEEKWDDKWIDFSCQNVYTNSESYWARARPWTQDPKPWIHLSLGYFYAVERINIRQRAGDEEYHGKFYSEQNVQMFKDISLKFSDGTKVDYKLSRNRYWNEVVLSYPVVSVFVKIIGENVYKTSGFVPGRPPWKQEARRPDNPGFSEIQVFGCYQGTP